MKRVPTGNFLKISGLPLTGQLTANAQGIPLGAFSFPAILRAVCNIRRHAGDVSVLQPCPFGVLKSCRKNRPLSFGRKLRSAVLPECRIYQWVIQNLPSSRPTRITSPNVVRSEAGSPGAMSGPVSTAYPFRRTTTERILRRGLRLMSCLVHAEARREADCLRYGGDLLSMWRHHS